MKCYISPHDRCGAISDFSTFVMYRNLRLLHMAYFLHRYIPDIPDKYQVCQDLAPCKSLCFAGAWAARFTPQVALWASFMWAPQAFPARPWKSQYCAWTGHAALCILYLMISCGSASPSIGTLQYAISVAYLHVLCSCTAQLVSDELISTWGPIFWHRYLGPL